MKRLRERGPISVLSGVTVLLMIAGLGTLIALFCSRGGFTDPRQPPGCSESVGWLLRLRLPYGSGEIVTRQTTKIRMDLGAVVRVGVGN